MISVSRMIGYGLGYQDSIPVKGREFYFCHRCVHNDRGSFPGLAAAEN
jgi:hypothetical protein